VKRPKATEPHDTSAPRKRRPSRARNAETVPADIEAPAVLASTQKRRRKDVPEASSADALARMKSQKGEGTKPELVVQALLEAAGLAFEAQAKVLHGVRRRADFVFRAKKIAIFVDGCFWHACPVHATWPKANAEWWRAKIEANRRRDRDTDARLEAAGWEVVRIWECDASHASTAASCLADAGISLAKSVAD
jgi:DNA mismatch endonuclease (patch repair protein)